MLHVFGLFVNWGFKMIGVLQPLAFSLTISQLLSNIET